MAMAFGHGVHALAWTAGQPGAHLARAVLSYRRRGCLLRLAPGR